MPALVQCEYYLSFGFNITMPRALSKDDVDCPKDPSASPLSVFLIISAKAYSSVGFGLSVLAIWLRWFLPEAVAPIPTSPAIISAPSKPRSKHRSPSRSPRPRMPPPTPIRRSSAPPSLSPPTSILDHKTDTSASVHRPRVSFADEHHLLRRNTAPMETSDPIQEEIRPPSPPPPVEALAHIPAAFDTAIPSPPGSLLMTSPTTVTTQVDSTTPPAPVHDAPEKSENPTPTSTPRSRKLRLSFHLKNKRTTPDKCREEAAPPEEASKPPKKPTHVFVPLWTTSRKSTPVSEVVLHEIAPGPPSTPTNKIFCHKSSSSTSSSGGSLPSMLGKKSQKRLSTPTPRTSPYEAPYFATPPIIFDDAYSKYLRQLPRFDGDAKSPRSPSTRVQGDRPASADGIASHDTQRPSPHARSASVNWTPRTIPGVPR